MRQGISKLLAAAEENNNNTSSDLLPKIDKVTLDIAKDALIAVGNEVFHAFARTSMSPIIYETLDYASGIADARGNLLTQGNGACGFIGLISPLIKEIISLYGQENMYPGDIFIINDPYLGGGSHLSDIGMAMPVFYQDQLIAFVGNKAHWGDVGGMAPGSFTTDSSEVFQEGICFSGLKLVEKGELNKQLEGIIRSNVRFPSAANGDMWGQIASLRTGAKRLNELADKYGVDTLLLAMQRLLDQGEQLALKRIEEFPKGSWEAQDYMDDDGHGNPVKIKVKVTISDAGFTADYSGSSPQVISPINTGSSSLEAAVKIVYMAILNPQLDVNDGVFRPMQVICEKGSVLNCKRPAPTSTYYESMLYAVDVLWQALAPVFPEALGAGHLLSVCSVVMSGKHHLNEEQFLIVEPTGGGWGASLGKDGEVGQFCVGDGETYNVPVEMAERRYGIMIDEYNLHTDGAGSGEYRGGSGAVRIYRAMEDGQLFTASFGRNKFPVWGMAGGKDGSHNYFEIHRADGSKEGPFGIVARKVMNKGDYARMVTATGGGYGNPLKRELSKVIADVKNGYISLSQAAADYGVELDSDLDLVAESPARIAVNEE